MLRFSLASLFIVILVAAVGCAGLLYANDFWRQIMVTLTMALLLFSTLAAVVWRRQSRACALGFAVSGWLYLLLAFSPSLALRDDLLTDTVVAWLFQNIHGKEVAGYYEPFATAPPYGRTIMSGVATNVRLWNVNAIQQPALAVDYPDFGCAGHSLWTMIIGCLGGMVHVWLCRRPTEHKT